MVDKLFKEIKRSNDLSLLSSYKKIINDNYHDELLDYYKELNVKRGSKCYGRGEYYSLCRYIKELYALNCPKNFVINLVKDMHPFYKNKKAFREEIMDVLNNDDKSVFKNLISGLK